MTSQNKQSNFVALLVTVMLFVIVFSAYLIRQNLKSVDSVSSKTDNLINIHVDGLQKIADLETTVSNAVIDLHRYYANIDPMYHELNLQEIESIKSFISTNSLLFSDKTTQEILGNLIQFEEYADLFHQEMSKSNRNWDTLRQHLYDSQIHSDKMVNLLRDTSKTIKDDVKRNSSETLDEITVLNNLQIVFVLGISAILFYVVFVMYGRVKDQERLFQLAFYDQVTGLPNKSNFEKQTQVANVSSSNQTVLLVNLDRYKLFTGRFGYLFGERLIETVSSWLTDNLHEQPCEIFKFTTTSWLIHISNYTDPNSINDFINKLLTISSSKTIIDDIELVCSFSIGASTDDNNEKQKVDLIREADAALNISIQNGGNCFNLYTEEMGNTIKQFVDIEHALRDAIDKDELLLYYQPKINAQTKEFSGSEVLLRWISNGKMIGPNIFIPIAEKSGLIVRIGEWVLEQACKQWVIWDQQGLKPLPVAVNISAMQFQDPKFPQIVQSILLKTRMPAYMLELEITEEAAAAKPELIIDILNQLKQIGVCIAIDDFGTGYSSLSYLKRFPLDVLKIDQSFIRDMDKSANDKDIVKLIVDLAKKLNYRIVAEGVETEEQYQQLKSWECDYMQGYLFSKPINSNDFTDKLKTISTKVIVESNPQLIEASH